uniref:GAG-pre-integrase domain-containing protein n=1 Tax=Nicotiana tabacum TaxID=4097 RepID=A0A1S3X9U0_TOBAC|nr:PREDICTED: uncharacterized protein LOC107762668 [Nicotiana tabacum]
MRFGHLNFEALKSMGEKNMVHEIPSINNPNQLCEACLLGKHARRSFPKESMSRATMPLQLVLTDVCGLINPPSFGKIYLNNRSPIRNARDQTPQEASSGRKPSVKHLKIFGSIACVHVPQYGRAKLDDRCIKHVFVSYDTSSKAASYTTQVVAKWW